MNFNPALSSRINSETGTKELHLTRRPFGDPRNPRSFNLSQLVSLTFFTALLLVILFRVKKKRGPLQQLRFLHLARFSLSPPGLSHQGPAACHTDADAMSHTTFKVACVALGTNEVFTRCSGLQVFGQLQGWPAVEIYTNQKSIQRSSKIYQNTVYEYILIQSEGLFFTGSVRSSRHISWEHAIESAVRHAREVRKKRIRT